MKVIRSVEGGGVKEEIQSTADGEDGVLSPALTDEEMKSVIQFGQTVKDLYNGNPQDIEWAMSKDGQIYIVQSRPITTLFPLPNNVPAQPLQVFFSFNASK